MRRARSLDRMAPLGCAAALLLAACDRGPPPPAASNEPPPAAPRPAAESALAQAGQPAPAFSATAHDGTQISLAGLKGKNVVLYFYPKDDTPGCTVEAQGFRDQHQALSAQDTVVLGVSTDDSGSHQAFAEKFDLPFLLLPDTDHAIARAYGVPISERGTARRVTFVIGKDGTLLEVFPDVDPDGHAQQVLAALSAPR